MSLEVGTSVNIAVARKTKQMIGFLRLHNAFNSIKSNERDRKRDSGRERERERENGTRKQFESRNES